MTWSSEKKMICLTYLKSDISCLLVFSAAARKQAGQAVPCNELAEQEEQSQHLIPNKAAQDVFVCFQPFTSECQHQAHESRDN